MAGLLSLFLLGMSTWCLSLVSPALPASSGSLELASLGAHVGLGVAVGHTRSTAKVTVSLTGLAGSCKHKWEFMKEENMETRCITHWVLYFPFVLAIEQQPGIIVKTDHGTPYPSH